MKRHWNTLSTENERRYGFPLYRIGVDASFSCPNRDRNRDGGCIFCDGTGASAVYQRGADDGVSPLLLESIEKQIERGKRFIHYRYKAEHAALYLQAFSNTYAPLERLKVIYDRALSCGTFLQFIVSTRPDCINESIASLLASYITKDREVWVELGLQSSSDDTLKRINRGHSVECFKTATALLKEKGIKVTAHVMFMPCFDKRDDYIKCAKIINERACDGVKVHNLLVAKGTELEREYLKDGCLTLSSVRRHIEDLAIFLSYLNKEVIVERLTSDMSDIRLTAPLHFPDKRDILASLDSYMEKRDLYQGSNLE